jgi:hypothetical protein
MLPAAVQGAGGTAAGNILRAFPIILAQGRTIESIAINVLAGPVGGAVARCGVYLDNGSLYPGALVQDFGELTLASTGVKTQGGFSRTLANGTLYWAAIWQSSGVGIQGVYSEGMFPIGASSNALGGANTVGWGIAKTYTLGSSVLPTTFDAGAGRISSVAGASGYYPVWFARFSS